MKWLLLRTFKAFNLENTALGALQTLNLTWCCSLTDLSMLAIAKHCSRALAL